MVLISPTGEITTVIRAHVHERRHAVHIPFAVICAVAVAVSAIVTPEYPVPLLMM